MRLDNYLLRLLKSVPKSHVYRIVRSGEVRVNRSRAKPGTRLAEHDQVRVPPVRRRERGQAPRPPDALKAKVQAAIVAETDDWIVFNKPPGLAVHGGSGLMFGLIEVLRAMRPDAWVELVHRLDRQTSGCLLVAKSRATLAELRSGLRAPGCEKHYLALVEGHWQGGRRRVDAPLTRDRERGGERMVEIDHAHGKRALSEFSPLRHLAAATLMAVRIRTGRTHQIRVHAAHCGHPLAADAKYGANARAAYWRECGLQRMFLHAARIDMPRNDARFRVVAPLADDLARVLEQLGAADALDDWV
ncbi:MAG TPA: RluA family pseudouridine synthase [Salinisphaeraceae bacterium]|nr:RluA family pseudouridine synthase [Salinisphaeraceae bacterium]